MSDHLKDEEPLDPVLESVRKRLMRSMLISIGILMFGLLVLLVAIVYRINQSEPETEASISAPAAEADWQKEIDLELSSGTRILSASIDRNYALVLLQEPAGDQSLIVVDLKTGKTISRLNP